MAQSDWTPVGANGSNKGWEPIGGETQGDAEFQKFYKSPFTRRLPKEEARRTLSQRSKYFSNLPLDEQDKLLAKLPGPGANTDTATDRFANAMGTTLTAPIRFAVEDVPKAYGDKVTAQEVGRHRRHPVMFAEPTKGVGLTLDRLILDPHIKEFQEFRRTGKEALKERSPGKASEAFGHGLASVTPGGPGAAAIGKELGQRDFASVAGQGAALALMGLFTNKMTRQVAGEKRMSAATGGGFRDYQVVSGDLAKEAARSGRPTTVGHLNDLVDATGRKLETDFNLLLQPIAGERRIPNEVAEALLAEANSSHLLKTPEGRQTRALLRQKAHDYMRPWSMGQLNKQRMDMFSARMESKTDVGQMAAMRSNAEIKANKIIEDKLRDIVYDGVARHYGDSVNVRLLKEKQSRLMDLKERLHDQVEALADSQAEFDSATLSEKIGLSLSAHTSGMTPRMHGLMKTIKGGPEVAANRQVRRAFPASLKDTDTKEGRSDVMRQGARATTRAAVRALPLTALYRPPEKQKKKPKPE